MTVAKWTTGFDPHGSSLIRGVYYNDETQELFVHLDTNDEIYGYRFVNKALYDDFRAAPSAGTFYNSRIKGRLHGTGLHYSRLEKVADNLEFVSQTQQFVVTGWVKTTQTIGANTLEEAVKEFSRLHPDVKVTEVTVKFS